MAAGELPIDAANLVEPMPAPIEGTVRGVLNLDVDLPPTASPKARVREGVFREGGIREGFLMSWDGGRGK